MAYFEPSAFMDKTIINGELRTQALRLGDMVLNTVIDQPTRLKHLNGPRYPIDGMRVENVTDTKTDLIINIDNYPRNSHRFVISVGLNTSDIKQIFTIDKDTFKASVDGSFPSWFVATEFINKNTVRVSTITGIFLFVYQFPTDTRPPYPSPAPNPTVTTIYYERTTPSSTAVYTADYIDKFIKYTPPPPTPVTESIKLLNVGGLPGTFQDLLASEAPAVLVGIRREINLIVSGSSGASPKGTTLLGCAPAWVGEYSYGSIATCATMRLPDDYTGKDVYNTLFFITRSGIATSSNVRNSLNTANVPGINAPGFIAQGTDAPGRILCAAVRFLDEWYVCAKSTSWSRPQLCICQPNNAWLTSSPWRLAEATPWNSTLDDGFGPCIVSMLDESTLMVGYTTNNMEEPGYQTSVGYAITHDGVTWDEYRDENGFGAVGFSVGGEYYAYLVGKDPQGKYGMRNRTCRLMKMGYYGDLQGEPLSTLSGVWWVAQFPKRVVLYSGDRPATGQFDVLIIDEQGTVRQGNLPTIRYVAGISEYNGNLYAIDGETGEIWGSVNGIKWFKLENANLGVINGTTQKYITQTVITDGFCSCCYNFINGTDLVNDGSKCQRVNIAETVDQKTVYLGISDGTVTSPPVYAIPTSEALTELTNRVVALEPTV